MLLCLEILTTLCIGLLIGAEFAVTAFIHPTLHQLDDAAQAAAIRLFARRLGSAMPFWYAGALLLLIGNCVVFRNHAGLTLLIAAAGIWAVVILLTILFLVPINNRIAHTPAGAFSAEARRDHARWDRLHRLRVATLVLSMCCYLAAVYLR